MTLNEISAKLRFKYNGIITIESGELVGIMKKAKNSFEEFGKALKVIAINLD